MGSGSDLAVDAKDAMASRMNARRELSEAACGVETARIGREGPELGEDEIKPVEVTRPEHLGLRPPLVLRGSVSYRGDTRAVALSREPQAFVTRTQNSVGVVTTGVVSVEDVAPAIGNAVLPECPTYHW